MVKRKVVDKREKRADGGNGRKMQGVKKKEKNNRIEVSQDNRFINKGKFPCISCE